MAFFLVTDFLRSAAFTPDFSGVLTAIAAGLGARGPFSVCGVRMAPALENPAGGVAMCAGKTGAPAC